MDDIRAFTMGSEHYFLGVVALLNSLRLTGHTMPLTVLDAGLAGWQRGLLEPHCDLRDARPELSVFLQKMDAPLASDADVVLMLDSDMIVCGSLAPVIGDARSGKVCAFRDSEQEARQRWFAEWEELFALRSPLRKEHYVNAGVVVVSTRRTPEFLPRWSEVCESVADQPMLWNSAGPSDPLWLADQDPLNALLQSELPPGSTVRYPLPGMTLGASNLAQVQVDDRTRLGCSCDGAPVTVLHAVGVVKPWQPRARREYRRTAYTILLRRLLAGSDVELRVPSQHLPRRFRPGPVGATTAWALHAYDVVARATRPLRRRLRLSSGREPVPALGS